MLHYTLNTGHTRTSPRSEVADCVIAALTPMLCDGVHRMPGPPGYSCRVDAVAAGNGLLATVIADDGRKLAFFGLAKDDAEADRLWPHLERLYLNVGDLPGFRSADMKSPGRPKSTPWCAACVLAATPSEAHWIADFERCLAWAWIERAIQ